MHMIEVERGQDWILKLQDGVNIMDVEKWASELGYGMMLMTLIELRFGLLGLNSDKHQDVMKIKVKIIKIGYEMSMIDVE